MKKRKPDRLGKEKIRGLKRARNEKLRITSKVVFYDKSGRVLCFTGDETRGGVAKPNFPGGGREKHERLWQTLKREVGQETSVHLNNAQAQGASILRRGKIPTTRVGIDFKYLVLSAIQIENLEEVTAKEEIANPRIFNSPADAIAWIEVTSTILDESVVKFYVSALRKLAKIIG